MNGFQPQYKTGENFGDVSFWVIVLWLTFGAEPYAKITLKFALYFWSFSLKLLRGLKPNLTVGTLYVPLGVTVLWSTFGAELLAKITFISAF